MEPWNDQRDAAEDADAGDIQTSEPESESHYMSQTDLVNIEQSELAGHHSWLMTMNNKVYC